MQGSKYFSEGTSAWPCPSSKHDNASVMGWSSWAARPKAMPEVGTSRRLSRPRAWRFTAIRCSTAAASKGLSAPQHFAAPSTRSRKRKTMRSPRRLCLESKLPAQLSCARPPPIATPCLRSADSLSVFPKSNASRSAAAPDVVAKAHHCTVVTSVDDVQGKAPRGRRRTDFADSSTLLNADVCAVGVAMQEKVRISNLVSQRPYSTSPSDRMAHSNATGADAGVEDGFSALSRPSSSESAVSSPGYSS
mmetsp:Transcript_17517/g.32255  ORF Transcript_17517/g.32255 Transcript_17517/m.32255 type:complete len:248 (+) Transcript_17517:1799-2542(+)